MQPSYAAYGAPAGQTRDIALVVILTFVTCGFYGIYWHYKMMSEIAADLGRTDINPILEIVLCFVTCGIYNVYLDYKYPKLITEMQAKRGMPINDISSLCMVMTILTFFGLPLIIVSRVMQQSELNRIWEGR
jgi:hypothetical protein